mgnify:CR=1 FL=1
MTSTPNSAGFASSSPSTLRVPWLIALGVAFWFLAAMMVRFIGRRAVDHVGRWADPNGRTAAHTTPSLKYPAGSSRFNRMRSSFEL